MKKFPKILFVIKERNVYGTKTACYGLVNSCEFVSTELKEHGIESNVVQVVDANGIDRVITRFRPSMCFIEAIWVTPEKIKELAKIHKNVRFVVRVHSMVPFFVSEGMVFDWLNEYMELRKHGVKISISCNNKRLLKDLSTIYSDVSYTPNIYKLKPEHCHIAEEVIEDIKEIIGDVKELVHDINHLFHIEKHDHILNVGGFGALRLMKNHCQEAIWTIQFANKHNKTLHFHINVSGHEQNEASPVLKNLRNIFKTTKHKLIEHTWLQHHDFLKLVKQMSFCLQLSMTETFDICAADSVFCNIPIIVSDEVEFISKKATVNISHPEEVMEAMELCIDKDEISKMTKRNIYLLDEKNEAAVEAWLNYLK